MRYEKTVPESMVDMRMDKFILKALPEIRPYAVREAFSHRDVKQNGKRVKPECKTLSAALVEVYTSEKEMAIEIVYEDEHVLLVNKPRGISVQEDAGGGATMLSLLQKQLKREELYLCHRLDNQTCGLLLLCKDAASEQLLRKTFYERSMDKQYTCMVKGQPRPAEAVREAYLIKQEGTKRVRIITKASVDAQKIMTGYRTVEAGEQSRLEIDLITGRMHQIRAHMAFLGHPVVGDDMYGDRAFNQRHKAKKLMLCASRLTFHVGGHLAYLDGQSFSVPVPF